MSFAKAKIQRFNELENDVPPPGAYDPKFNTVTKGVTLDKSSRFTDSRSTTATDCSLPVCNRSTNQFSMTFRTPQPTQKTGQKRSTKIKARSILPVTDTKLKYTSENELVDLQIECVNKTKTIEEHVKHIQDLQEEIQKLQSQLENLHKSQAETSELHRKEIESMIQLQQEVLKMHTEKHEYKVELLQKQVLENCEAKTCEIQTLKDLETDLRSQISVLNEKINTLECELANQKQINEDKETQNKLLKLEGKSSAQEIEISRLETRNGELDLQLKESKVTIHSLMEVKELCAAETAKLKNTLAEIQLQQEVSKMYRKQYQSELDQLEKQVLETREAKTREIQTLKDVESDLRSQISVLNEKINTLECELTNQKQISEDKETQNKLFKLEEKSSTQEIEISRLETRNGELDLQLKESKVAIHSMTEVNEALEAETAELNNTLAEANARIEELSNSLLERGDNVEDKTELLEKEIARRKAVEEEVQKLLEYNARLKKDHDEINEQYAELIGHQNHRQRIKHVSQLKDKINQLEKDLRAKTTKIEQQQKIIEKIKSEEKRVPNKLG